MYESYTNIQCDTTVANNVVLLKLTKIEKLKWNRNHGLMVNSKYKDRWTESTLSQKS